MKPLATAIRWVGGSWLRALLAGVVAGLAQAVLWIATSCLEVRDSKLGDLAFAVGVGSFLLLLLALLTSVILLARWSEAKRERMHELRFALMGAVMVGVCLLGLLSGPAADFSQRFLRKDFDQFTRDVRPLIEAIRSYEADFGQPPPHLDALVPKYFSEAKFDYVMHGSVRTVRYELLSTKRKPSRPELRGGSWALTVDVPCRAIFEGDPIPRAARADGRRLSRTDR